MYIAISPVPAFSLT
ncbi:hypothetical protein VCHENC02_4964A, partial [Vibrio harveyi]